MANLIPKIAKMLGVELGEKFKIKGENELMTYSFNSSTSVKSLLSARVARHILRSPFV